MRTKICTGMLLLLTQMLLLNSCIQTTASSSSSSDTSASTTSDSSSDSDDDSTTTTDDDSDDEVTYYDEEDEEEDDTPGDEYEDCGILYKVMNDDTLKYQASDNTVYEVEEYSYDSASYISQVKFGNSTYADAYDVCLTGYTSSSTLYLDEVDWGDETDNPSKLYDGNYSYEFCGYMAHTNYGHQFTYIVVSGTYYKVNNETGSSYDSSIPTVGTTISSSNGIEACVYSNSSTYKNYSESMYSNIDAKAIDLGDYN